MKNIKRINITIDEELLNKIDSYSKKRYLSRSGLISLALSTYLDTVEKNSFSSFTSLSRSVSDVKGRAADPTCSDHAAIRHRATLDERK